MRDLLEMLGLYAVLALASTLPHGAALGAGRAIGRLLFRCGLRRRVSLENLERAFGGAFDAPARRRIAARSYEHLGMTLVELLRLGPAEALAVRERLETHGVEHLHAALARGRGAIVASAHYGNWEVLGAGAVACGLPVTFVVQRMRNRAADSMLCRRRESAGVRVLERGMALRRVREELGANRLVSIMCDQDARRRGVFVPFFGVPASTHKGAAQLALRHDAPFIPAFGRRLPDGRHRMLVYPPLEPPAGVDEEEAVLALLTRFNQLLEEVIREEPQQYLWLHRRWKTALRAASSSGPDASSKATRAVRRGWIDPASR
ncbi:MAG: lysophospholipid acyltransferase family protein [Candidatus Krumholzibacteriia bacterium]